MLRRPTPWQRGRRKRTLRGFGRVVRASLVVGALSLLLGTTASSSTMDDTPPVVTYTVDGIQGANGWYRGSTSSASFVIVHWTVSDPESPITSAPGCEPAVRIDDPNSGTTRMCSATSAGGTTAITTKTIKVDSDPPASVAASPSRGADANGWYNHAFGLAWSGSDATSGIAGCSSMTYSGPDKSAGAITGGCTDLAGNSSSTTFSFNYDATPPQLTAASVQSTDGANIVHWKSSSPQDVAAIGRVARGSRSERSLFSGGGVGFVDKKIQAGVEYRYTVRTYDEAGNASAPRTMLALPKVISLGKNGYTPRTAKQPILRWPARRGASYYHVQLFRDGKRILAAWPLTTQLALHAHWRWAGHRYRLSPGTYAWFAWAGIGPRSAARYKRIGHSTFIVPGR
jgi:hypothetical protein